MNTLLEPPAEETSLLAYPLSKKPGKRILVADDDADFRHLALETLARSGYEVDDAENGARAWKALHLRRYDLLVTDYDMPEMTGLELVRKLRMVGLSLPVVLSSESLPPDLLAKNASLRFAAILAKPFTIDEFVATVRDVLRAPTSDLAAWFGKSLPQQARYSENYVHLPL